MVRRPAVDRCSPSPGPPTDGFGSRVVARYRWQIGRGRGLTRCQYAVVFTVLRAHAGTAHGPLVSEQRLVAAAADLVLVLYTIPPLTRLVAVPSRVPSPESRLDVASL